MDNIETTVAFLKRLANLPSKYRKYFPTAKKVNADFDPLNAWKATRKRLETILDSLGPVDYSASLMGYHVYVYIEPDTGMPIYHGLTCMLTNRDKEHRRTDEKNRHLFHKLRSLDEAEQKVDIISLANYPSKKLAGACERFLIRVVGRQKTLDGKFDRTGPLYNIADGGGYICGLTVSESVQLAKKLAKENGSKLQSAKWLQQNGYSGLDYQIRNNPEAFAGIEQERYRKSLEETVEKAKKMAQANGGKLQNIGWLMDNGHNDINNARRKHPESFAGIEQEWKGGKLLEEKVAKAEKLVKENGGKLQNDKWLINNGCYDVYHAIHDHPEAFSGIEQEYKGGKPLKETISKAKKLAKENGGKLPKYKWLVDNRHFDVTNALRKHPEAFVDIERTERYSREATKCLNPA